MQNNKIFFETPPNRLLYHLNNIDTFANCFINMNHNLHMQKIELLSPAKNLETGIAAINHGADAVYIGAPMFSARAAAGNSIQDIEDLARYAHQYRSKVLVALNTILTDSQLPIAEKLIKQIYEAGADALIVQDMGVLQLDIPPIALHASTQADNRTVEKVKFLQDVGFSRVVLARELTLNQIKRIKQNTDVELEVFVHGALCVSYSGQCYISQAMTGRSANRGECSQYCRLPYTLTDSNGVELARNKHMLSLKDLDMSEHLEELIDAGVSTLKIEGRLKNIEYVKNITAMYRQKLDSILEHRPDVRRASMGTTRIFFNPNPEKSFRRNATDYFIGGRKWNVKSEDRNEDFGLSQLDTPKSLGEKLGRLVTVARNHMDIATEIDINNGDGLCFVNSDGVLTGFRVNRAERLNNVRVRVFPAETVDSFVNAVIYRNQDHEFDKILSGKTSERKIGLDIDFSESSTGFIIQIADEEGISVITEFESEKQPAKNIEIANKNIVSQLSKLGNTIYEVKDINISTENHWFIPAGKLNEWRRISIEVLDAKREKEYKRPTRKEQLADASFPVKKLTYLGNVINEKAEAFYKQFGVDEVLPGFEAKAEADVPLMYCKYCIKHTMGWCPREGHETHFTEPLFLQHKNERFKLEFDCKKCEMLVLKG